MRSQRVSTRTRLLAIPTLLVGLLTVITSVDSLVDPTTTPSMVNGSLLTLLLAALSMSLGISSLVDYTSRRRRRSADPQATAATRSR